MCITYIILTGVNGTLDTLNGGDKMNNEYKDLYDNGTCSLYVSNRNGMIYFGFNFLNDGQPLFYREWSFEEAKRFADTSKMLLETCEG